jgi:hypothetical protein
MPNRSFLFIPSAVCTVVAVAVPSLADPEAVVVDTDIEVMTTVCVAAAGLLPLYGTGITPVMVLFTLVVGMITDPGAWKVIDDGFPVMEDIAAVIAELDVNPGV